MTREELARVVAKKAGLTNRQAEDLISSLGTTIADALEHGNKVVYSNFGTFYTVHYPSKVIIHPRLGLAKKMIMLPTNVAKWMPAPNIKKMVNEGTTAESATIHGRSKGTTTANGQNSFTSPGAPPSFMGDQVPQNEKLTETDSNPSKKETGIEIPITTNKTMWGQNNLGTDVPKSAQDSEIEFLKQAPPVTNTVPPPVNNVGIFEEVMDDGSKEEATFDGVIRLHEQENRPFWSRVFNRKSENIKEADGPVPDEKNDQEERISLLNAGIFNKNEASALSSNLPSATPPPPAPETPAISTEITPEKNQATFGQQGLNELSLSTPENSIKTPNEQPPISNDNEKELVPFSTARPAVEYVDLSRTTVPKEILQQIPEKLARSYMAVPLEDKDGTLVVAMTDPEDIEAKELIKKQVQKPITLCLATETDINHILDQYQGLESEVQSAIEQVGDNQEDEQLEEGEKKVQTEEVSDDAPAARIVTSVLRRAIRDKASDLHIEPLEKEIQVRFRIDGILHKKVTLPKDIQSAVVSRIKILGNLKIDEQRLPQDGRFSIKFDNRRVDFRVSTMPTAFGEKVVIRILDKMSGILSVEELGLSGTGLNRLQNSLSKSHGMILVTGPTGSGKTTTLYALVDKLFAEGVNIVTLEDPIEYQMPGINQSQVNAEINYTFANGLRSIVRQDPDIIMIGEIRDGETAAMAVQAALTGHIVLSTLHTNDAAGAAPRLIDMGVEPFLLTSSINLVVGQRLARKICEECKEKVDVPEEELVKVREIIANMPEEEKKEHSEKELSFYHGKGCKNCNETGYKGRIGIFEVLEVTEEIKELVLKKVSSSLIMAKGVENGMVTMIQDGIIKAIKGATSIEEVWRVTKD